MAALPALGGTYCCHRWAPERAARRRIACVDSPSSEKSEMDLETALKLMDDKAKPPGSLGALEYWAAQLCVIQNTSTPSLDYARLLVFAGDHGVVAENVTSYPSAVTASIFATIAAGKAASSVIAASQGIEIEVIDVGIACDVSKFYGDIAFNAKV